MNIESKKILATQVMGYKYQKNGAFDPECFIITHNLDILVKDWNPHISNTQFIEVLRKLTSEQSHAIGVSLYDIDEFRVINNDIQSFVWIQEHKPEVLEAILEVVK